MRGIKKLFAPIDMTVGRPWENILLFTVPMLLGNIAQQLYNTVDSIVVGRYVGDNALAAVGSAGPILNLLLVLMVGVSTGAGIKVAQYFGARDRDSLSKTIGNSIVLMLIASLIISVVGVLVARPMLVLLRTPESIVDWCTSYLHILFIGFVGMGLYNILGGILRGLGDSVSALVYLLIACALNIVLDIWFVASFGMGVNGVALATAIAQTVSALLCARKLYSMKHLFDLGWEQLKLRKKYAATIIRLGLPSGITQGIMSMSMILVQSLTNTFGELMIAANVIVMRIDGFAMMPNFSFAMAMTTFAGQNVGARRPDRVREGSKQGTLMALAVSSLITVTLLFFGRYLMMIFTDTPELIERANKMLRILAVGYIAMAVTQSFSGVMRGAGDTVTPMWISIVQTIGLRMPLAYILCYLTRSAENVNGRWEMLPTSLMIAWVCGMLATCWFYKHGKWRNKLQ